MILNQCGAPGCSTLTASLTEYQAEISVPGNTEATRVMVRACCESHIALAVVFALEGARQRGAEIDAEEDTEPEPDCFIVAEVIADGVTYVHAHSIPAHLFTIGADFGTWGLSTYGGTPGPRLKLRRVSA